MGVNSLTQIFLQTHNLQRTIFRIFSYQSRKINFKQSKKKIQILPQWGHTTILSSSTDRNKRFFNIKCTFSFFSRGFWRSFLHKSLSWFSCCVSFLNVFFIYIFSWLPWLFFFDVFGKYFLQNALIHPVYLAKSLFEQIFTLSKRYKAGLVG